MILNYIKDVASLFPRRFYDLFCQGCDGYLLEMSSELDGNIFIGNDLPIPRYALPPDRVFLIDYTELKKQLIPLSV